MAWQKIVRLVLKIVITFITLSVLLTSFVGGISMILIVSDLDDNFQIDSSNSQANFGAAGNNFSISLNFTNEGYFSFNDFAISLKIDMENKTSTQEIIFLDRQLYINNLLGKHTYSIDIVATEDHFSNQSLLDDMENSWNDPEVDALIASNASLEPLLRVLSFPYILNAYDIDITLSITSSYNLGLIDFGLDVEFPIRYEDHYAISYDQLKQDLKDLHGL